MAKCFNVNGSCDPEIHYMVDISDKLQKIKAMVDAGEYFTINKARQYGKTTTLNGLAELLQNEYEVIYLDFQMLSYGDFETEEKFVSAFSNELLINCMYIPDSVKKLLIAKAKSDYMTVGNNPSKQTNAMKVCDANGFIYKPQKNHLDKETEYLQK